MILRDRDANTNWESQADGTLEERTYYCQNWRADVIALITDTGSLINQVRYDPYGVPFGISKADVEADGDVDSNDSSYFANTVWPNASHPLADWDWDGTKDTNDLAAYAGDYNTDTALGRGDPSYAYGTAGGANRRAYAGYEIDPILTGSEGWESVYHARHRVLLSQLGRWTRRDPLGYVDGMSLYAYVDSEPIRHYDAMGLLPCPDDRPCDEDADCDCPTFDDYSDNSQVQEALRMVRDHCNCTPKIKCEWWVPPDGAAVLPDPLSGCPAIYLPLCSKGKVSGSTIAHELRHVWQICDGLPCIFGFCETLICMELDAYEYAGDCTGGADCCDAACKSVRTWSGGICNLLNDCNAKCEKLV